MLFSLLTTAAIAGSAVARPTGWKSDLLEEYQTYHLRYVALNCAQQHNSSFFDDCCHPIKANQNATVDLPSYCQPNATAVASASAKIAAANATVTASLPDATASVDANDDSSEQFSSASSSASAETATSTETATATATETATSDASQQIAANYENDAPASSSSSSSTSSEEPQQTQESNSNSNSAPQGDNTGGEGTYYSQGNEAGACGQHHSDSDLVVAASTAGQYYPNPNAVSPYCGRQVRISRADGKGNTVVATIADACPSCGNGNDLDLSMGTYAAINGNNNWGEGRFPIVWSFA